MQDTCIIIPAFNEALQIDKTIDELLITKIAIIVVDDGSADKTCSVLSKRSITLLKHPFNLGQGAALQTGIDYAITKGFRYFVTFDADGQHNPLDILPMVNFLKSNDLEIVLGSRFKMRDDSSTMPKARKLVLKMAKLFTKATTGVYFSDVHNGFRAFNLSFAKKFRFKQNKMAHASEILSFIAKNNIRFDEYSTAVSYTGYSLQKGQSNLGSVKIVSDLIKGKLFK